MRLWLATAALFAVCASCVGVAYADEYPFMRLGREAFLAPIGQYEFCAAHTEDCAPVPLGEQTRVRITRRGFKELFRVNRLVNIVIKPLSDLENYGEVEKWAYPDNGYGDCEDLASLKKKLLVGAGWPRGALVLAAVYEEKTRTGHVLLIVRTNIGDYALDNRTNDIVRWDRIKDYYWSKLQSAHDPRVWRYIEQEPLILSSFKN